MTKEQLAAEIRAVPTRFKAVGKYLIVLPLAPDERTQGGLYVPDIAREKPQLGRVLSVGDDVAIELEQDQEVLYAKYSGHEITEQVELEDGTKHDRNILVMPVEAVLAIAE